MAKPKESSSSGSNWSDEMKTPITASALHLYDMVQAFMTQQGMVLTVEEAAAIRQLLHIVPSMNLLVNVRPDVFVESLEP